MVPVPVKGFVRRRFFRVPDVDLATYLTARASELPEAMIEESAFPGRVERLRDDPEASSPSFQGVLAVTLSFVERVHVAERHAAAAALSLAQRESLAFLVGEVNATTAALRGLGGRDSAPSAPTADDAGPGSWWYALAEATQTIEIAVDRLSAMVATQPKGAAVRSLVTEVLRVLRAHHRVLMGEATRWIEG